MKHSTILPTTLLFSLSIAVILFLITISVAFAQTATQLRPATVDVTNVKSEQPKIAPSTKPIPTLFDSTRDVRKVETQRIDVKSEVKAQAIKAGAEDNAADKPQTFLEKARDVLQKKRQETDRMRSSEDVRGEQKEEREEKLKEQKKDRLSGFINNIKRKMDAAISRLGTLAERIESRIIKFEERGIDMSKARTHLEAARGSIASAVESTNTAIEDAQNTLETDASRESFGGVASGLAKSKESLRDAHASLVEVIRTMKASLSNNQTGEKETNSNDTEKNEEN